jgi:serine/tyrosine/threonine adenylyltransferase
MFSSVRTNMLTAFLTPFFNGKSLRIFRSGRHFGFMNQPSAGYVNYQVLVESVVPVIAASSSSDDTRSLVDQFMDRAKPLFEDKVENVFRRKLGLSEVALVDDLWEPLQRLMVLSRVDWTLFFRQLTVVAAQWEGDYESNDYEDMLKMLESTGDQSPFYEPLTQDHRNQFLEWIQQWRQRLHEDQANRQVQSQVSEQMRMANPKYILREWMMVKAYKDAANKDYDELHSLFQLIQNPYDEGTPDQQTRYYRRTPAEADLAAGTAFMSCSS